jgi:hypothetical protein
VQEGPFIRKNELVLSREGNVVEKLTTSFFDGWPRRGNSCCAQCLGVTNRQYWDYQTSTCFDPRSLV